mmetsp:Transcript_23025/g.51620  ORF Transcript_23025/g.51620 Transcript_23025/m.51620 type:complete len:315 (+) Transcript_23025:148-1092(+)
MASLLLVLLILTSVIAVADSHSDSRRQGTQQDEEKETSFSRPNWLKKFRAAGLEADTDKVGGFHNYEYVYGKYFAHDTFRSGHRTIRLLEIGLGCNMGYGPGHSVKLWQLWFPSLDLHEMEYDAACVQKWSAEIASMQNVTVHVGDQANFADLQKVLDGAGVRAGPTPWEAGENQFDVIIDDGGHYYEQIKNSFEVFFEKALKPGGLYVIEDVAPLRPPYPGRAYNDGQIITWLQGMQATILGNAGTENSNINTDPLNMHAPQARWVTSLEISKNAAAIVKATPVDCKRFQAYCPDSGFDPKDAYSAETRSQLH